MNDKTFKFLLLFAISASLSCSAQEAKINELCEKDLNCIQNAFCALSPVRICLCEPYYSPSLDNSMCIASAGLSCTDDSKCSSMRNAACRQGVCACKDPFILDINNSSNCIPGPLRVSDPCQRTDECQDALGRATCINEQCQCILSYHFVTETGKCIQSRALGDTCSTHSECRGSNNENNLECRNSKCVCKNGEATCSKASSTFNVSQLLYVIVFIVGLLSSCGTRMAVFPYSPQQ